MSIKLTPEGKVVHNVIDFIGELIKDFILFVFYLAVILIGFYVIWSSSLANGVIILLLGIIAWNTSKIKEKQAI